MLPEDELHEIARRFEYLEARLAEGGGAPQKPRRTMRDRNLWPRQWSATGLENEEICGASQIFTLA
jgi:hypothetical protein